jgi:hypothetical protein
MMRLEPSDLDLSAVPPAAFAAWLEERARYQRECGCEAGAVGAVVGFAALVAWKLPGSTTLSTRGAIVALGELLLVTVFAALVGKLVGLARARARFRRVTLQLLGPTPPAGMH